ncbi:MAG TPA: hypothetical protein VIN08_25820 [Ohtaekwangia sp.]|uniref:hypothetical protein n=1 Tax=Ohtaekwangia sp. TaxID=2066019 RepID=UPI002F95EB09
MERITRYIGFVIAIAVINVMASCGGDNATDPATEAANKLSGTWAINGGYVKADGADVTSDYTGLAITFTETKSNVPVYAVQNGGYAFNNITFDTWNFTDNTFTAIERGQDEIVMHYTITDDALTLNFTVPDPLLEGGRAQGIFGDFEIKLKKK